MAALVPREEYIEAVYRHPVRDVSRMYAQYRSGFRVSVAQRWFYFARAVEVASRGKPRSGVVFCTQE